jgi:N6-adenosine-specific RNA methylase IME4
MSAVKFHPLANAFLLLEGSDFDALVADIKANGQREAITVLDGLILDGRNRYRACRAVGINPQAVDFDPTADGDPLAFVISKNLRRRHMDESMRAMVGARLETLRHGGNRKSKGQNANLHVDRSTAAKLVNVSPRSIASAAIVRDKAIPQIVQAVDHGNLSISQAAIAAKLAPEQQKRIASEAEAGRVDTARKVIKQAARKIREVKLGNAQASGNLNLPNKRYGVIIADPEWRFDPWSRETGMDRAADNHYPTSTTEVIASRPVEKIAAADCVLFLWSTVPMLPDALAVLAAWGFRYKSHFVWVKDRAGTGYWNRNEHELLLVGTNGDIPAPAPGSQKRSVISAPVGDHSVKPDQAYELIEAYFPSLPKIELNARRARPGWDTWGLDAPSAPPHDPIAGEITEAAEAAE